MISALAMLVVFIDLPPRDPLAVMITGTFTARGPTTWKY
jgi:hypothetical protein